MWTLLILALCSTLQLIVSHDFDCDKDPDKGPCKALMPRFYYDQESETCKSFIYGGCKGNRNNFQTEDECYKRCGVSGGEVQSEALSSRSPVIPVCKANEEYQRCGCLKTCCNGGTPQGCAAQCIAGCFCKEGLVKNKNGDCIPLKDCNKTSEPPTTCGADEEYYTCVPNCHNTCETYNLTNIACPQYCKSGCFCKKGWVKRNDGKCVPTSQCSTPPTNVCPLGEEYKVCGTACPRTCANLKYQIRCTNQCVKGCFCKDGLVRNKNNVCVDPEKCPNEPPVCEKDEKYYEDCAPSCTGTCEAYNNKGTYNCPLCRPGCWCKKGFLKNKDGKCVPHSKCDKPADQCGANEEFKECGTTCPVTCSNLGRRTQVCKKDCVRGCFCLKGFIKNHEGECVDPSECPPQECGQNEEYDSCGSACPKTCENKDKNIFCSLQCVPGCFCTNGFVKNAQGKCIDPSQCATKQCGVNEEYKTCGSACPPKCSNRGKHQVCTQQCVKGCFCKKDYIKNDNGICVKPSECQTNQCGVDEVYEECGTACPRTCASLYTKIRCTEKCVPGCFCKDDLVRHNGKCIDISDCQTHQCGTNEEYKKCGTACPETCSNLGKPQVCTDECIAGCFCKEGFVRTDNGECVKRSHCPSNQCGAGEIYQECGTACPRTCSNMQYQIKCIAKCVEGCFCKEGLVKNDAGECVEPRKCPSECGENEEYGTCGSACPKTCKNKDENVVCTLQCKKGCFCRKGYVRNDQRKCILPDQCPIECKGYNEALVDCAKPKSCNTCEIRGNCKLKKCDKGCDCKPGFFRNATEICIPESQCPDVSEGFDCNKGPETGPCKARMPRFYYDQESGTCKSFIYGGCKGNKNNFLREDECFKKCGDGSEVPDCDLDPETGPCFASILRFYYDKDSDKCKSFTYGGCLGNSNNFVTENECYKKCGRPSTQSVCNLPPKVGSCKASLSRFYYDPKAGKCKKFFYSGCGGNRNNFKTVEDCNKICERQTGHCGVDEEFKTCGTACPETCSNRGKPVNCTRQCVRGCFCKKGLVRNDAGKCVRPDTCPTGQCGFNEEFKECGTACPKTCRNLNIKISCVHKCVKGCFCKEGFVRNDDGECVRPRQCPTEKCGENEEYSNCGSACPLTCENKDKSIICTLQCKIGCFCKKGYVKNGKGKCILPEDCPEDECNGYNEALVDCAKPKWCNTCTIKGNCKLPKCEEGCDCKPNYYRNATGICIHAAQCPGFCPVNEEYSTCVNPCNDCETRGQCNFLVCNKGCDCKEGYHRDANNICIPAEACPVKQQCGVNEVYKKCGTACPKTCSNMNEDYACIEVCVEGCFCKDGLVKNDDGICVKPSECPEEECSGYNEEYVECAKPKWCNTCDIRGNCKVKCIKGCDCKPNYYRNELGVCIPEAKCPGCPLNEEHSNCVIPCNTCEIRGKCNFLVCNKGCDCKKGYYRDANRKCIPADTCPIINPPNPVCEVDEEYYNCTPDCKNTCENYSNPHVACPKICRRGCFCKQGLVKRSDGECVKPTECIATEQCGVNEVYKDCGTACPKTCSNMNEEIMCIQVCVNGCFCKDGLVKNDDGICVKPSECPNEQCGVNEEYTKCGSACVVTCDNIDEDLFCTQDCKIGCFCKKGYVRNRNGICIRPERCPSEPPTETCGRHEQYYDCIPDCHNTCETYNRKDIACRRPCRSGCFCKKGYVLQNDNKCVRPAKCNLPTEPPPLCGKDEEYYEDCAPSCTGSCDTYGKEAVILCPICTPGCWCKKGLVKNKDGKCVPLSKCDKPTEPTPSCPKDQQYYPCIPTCKRTCMTHNSTDYYCTKECIKGCFCKEGLVMDKGGKCVKPEQCPPSCDFTQQYYDCMPDCKNRCNPPKFCPMICRSGCYCREDLVLREDGLCVNKDLCDTSLVDPPVDKCGPNKEYYECYSKCQNSCSVYGSKHVVCPAVCEKGCFCKRGMLLNEDGECVTPAECEGQEGSEETESIIDVEGGHIRKSRQAEIDVEDEEVWRSRSTRQLRFRRPYELGGRFSYIANRKKCGPNEKYNDCGSACPETCSNYGRPQMCTLQCTLGCFCKEGYIRNAESVCILPSECPQDRRKNSNRLRSGKRNRGQSFGKVRNKPSEWVTYDTYYSNEGDAEEFSDDQEAEEYQNSWSNNGFFDENAGKEFSKRSSVSGSRTDEIIEQSYFTDYSEEVIEESEEDDEF